MLFKVVIMFLLYIMFFLVSMLLNELIFKKLQFLCIHFYVIFKISLVYSSMLLPFSNLYHLHKMLTSFFELLVYNFRSAITNEYHTVAYTESIQYVLVYISFYISIFIYFPFYNSLNIQSIISISAHKKQIKFMFSYHSVVP